MIIKDLGDKINLTLKRKNWSREDLASKLGVGIASVLRMLSSDDIKKLDVFVALCQILEFDMQELLEEHYESENEDVSWIMSGNKRARSSNVDIELFYNNQPAEVVSLTPSYSDKYGIVSFELDNEYFFDLKEVNFISHFKINAQFSTLEKVNLIEDIPEFDFKKVDYILGMSFTRDMFAEEDAIQETLAALEEKQKKALKLLSDSEEDITEEPPPPTPLAIGVFETAASMIVGTFDFMESILFEPFIVKSEGKNHEMNWDNIDSSFLISVAIKNKDYRTIKALNLKLDQVLEILAQQQQQIDNLSQK